MSQRALAFILSAIAFNLTGCKADPGKPDSGMSAQVATQTPAATTPPDTRSLIVCFGDSLTAGFGTDPGQAYPDYLQQLLDKDAFHYRILNAGVSGDTTKDGLVRLPRVIAHKPTIVVLEFGGNDGLRGLPLEQTQANIATMIEGLQAEGITVTLAGITLPPEYGTTYIAKFNAMYPALARKYKTHLLPFLLNGVWNTTGDMQDDHTHATAQGNKVVAANVEKLLLPLLKH